MPAFFSLLNIQSASKACTCGNLGILKRPTGYMSLRPLNLLVPKSKIPGFPWMSFNYKDVAVDAFLPKNGHKIIIQTPYCNIGEPLAWHQSIAVSHYAGVIAGPSNLGSA